MGIGGLGMGEMVVIFLVVLLLFGAKRLPEIGSSLGKGIREFKGSIREIEKEVKAVDDEPRRDAVPPTPAASDEPDEEPRRLTTNPPPGSPDIQTGGVPTADNPAANPPGNWSGPIEDSAEIPEGEAEEESSTEDDEPEKREREA